MSDPLRVVVFPCILSYPSLFEKKKWEDQEKEHYQVDLWFPVSEPRYTENWNILAAARAAAIAQKWGQNVPHKMYDPLRNLADVRDLPEGMAGFFIRAKSAVKVAIRRRDPNSPPGSDHYIEVTDPADVYPGVIGAASLTALAFDQEKQKGVSFWLNQIVLLRDGTRLGGGGPKTVEEEFGGALAGQFGQLSTGDARAAAALPQAPPQYAPAPPGTAYPTAPPSYSPVPPAGPAYPPPQYAPPQAAYQAPQAYQAPPMPPQNVPPQFAPPGPHIPGMPGHPLPY